jgi:hypothetical protein
MADLVNLLPTQTDLGPAANPVEFMQPSPKGLPRHLDLVLPNGAKRTSICYARPTNGLLDPNYFLL